METRQHTLVVGGGVGGLAAALTLARTGYRVTVLERDDFPVAADVESAFAADRHGAPQVHQTHAFLARLVVELRTHLPDVLERLLDAGCSTMSGSADLGEPEDGDEDLSVLIVRRTTFEWVLRQAVLAEASVTVRSGVGVDALVASTSGPVPIVTGVRLEDGEAVAADVVVAATGRRGPVDAWLADIGVDVREVIHPSGLMYLSRWYRLPDGDSVELDARLGGDLGFVKYLAVPGDGGTLSVTLAIRADDKDLRTVLSDAEGYEDACRLLPGPDQFFNGPPLEPIGGVRPMGGLINRERHFVDADENPTVLGFHTVGDAHTCTNPLYGRGCTMAVVQSLRLAEAAATHPSDATERARMYERTCDDQVRPWYEVSLQMDKLGAEPPRHDGEAGGRDPGEGAPEGGRERPGGDAGAKGLAALFGAAASDPVIGRAFARFMNALSTPAEMMKDPELLGRIATVMADPDAVTPPMRREGPRRSELLAALTGAGGS